MSKPRLRDWNGQGRRSLRADPVETSRLSLALDLAHGPVPVVGEWLLPGEQSGEKGWSGGGRMEGENSGVEGVGQYFPGRPSPLDVLMHVENNLTANLLHSFSFLPGLYPPTPLPLPLPVLALDVPGYHPFLASLTARRTYRTLSLLLYPRPRVVEPLVSSLFRRSNRPALDPRRPSFALFLAPPMTVRR